MSFVENHGNYFKNNQTLIGNHLRVTGNNNTITGNHNTIIGNNNIICGNHCNVTGNNNKLIGNHAFMDGNNNTGGGSFIQITGNNTKITGSKSSYISNFSSGPNFGRIGDNVSFNYGNEIANDNVSNMFSSLFGAFNISPRKEKREKKEKKSKKSKKISPVEGDEWVDASSGKRLIYKNGQWVDVLDIMNGSSEEKKDRMECVICMDNRKNIIIKPCNHLCCCEECSKNIGDKCPICRTNVKKIEKVYI
jgi:hypothetical protein